ncbi:unnamed protein product [Toxocara canis]|uniref:DUF4604 domain-containing protein n=1 Tax=Toxocara canis TaxID=6265 RepID=A0A183V9E9_TOXCA|nr:unnamed protein product [Toxocara canis]
MCIDKLPRTTGLTGGCGEPSCPRIVVRRVYVRVHNGAGDGGHHGRVGLVYGENAMRLFAEEKSAKQKSSKANKNKAKNIDRKKDNTDEQKRAEKEQKHAGKEQKYHETASDCFVCFSQKKIEESVIEIVEPSETINGTENGKNTEAMSMHEAKHPRKKNKNKHQTDWVAFYVDKGPKAIEAMQAEKSGEAFLDLDNIEISALHTKKMMVVESTAIEEAPAAEGTEKKAKRKRARRAEDYPREAPKEVMESFASEPKLEDLPALKSTKEEKKTEWPKSKRGTFKFDNSRTLIVLRRNGENEVCNTVAFCSRCSVKHMQYLRFVVLWGKMNDSFKETFEISSCLTCCCVAAEEFPALFLLPRKTL